MDIASNYKELYIKLIEKFRNYMRIRDTKKYIVLHAAFATKTKEANKRLISISNPNKPSRFRDKLLELKEYLYSIKY